MLEFKQETNRRLDRIEDRLGRLEYEFSDFRRYMKTAVKELMRAKEELEERIAGVESRLPRS